VKITCAVLNRGTGVLALVPLPNLSVSQNGSGLVTSTPAGISCAKGSTNGCAAFFPSGTITLTTATAEQWNGCTGFGGPVVATSCVISLSQASPIGFVEASTPSYKLTVTQLGIGSVTSTPPGINCTSGSTLGCSAGFPPGTTVKLMTLTPRIGAPVPT
jgi:hypothetical protein